MTASSPSPMETRAGFVTLLGAPNVGKSTLLNQLAGTKLSIVTHKVQTTRTRVLGVVISGTTQIAFVDTPGIFKPRRRLDRAMVAAAWRGAVDADAVVMLVDAAKGLTSEEETIIDGLRQNSQKAILALNKVDSVKKKILLPLAERLTATGVFTGVFMLSALTGEGVPDLLSHLTGLMPMGPWLFPEDQLTDMPLRLLAAEVTREKLFLNVHQELPYELTVETDAWEENENGGLVIQQTIHVRRESQRAIILGRKGRTIKRIGIAARAELEEMLERRLHLSLHVRVRANWADDPARYAVWNLDFDV